MKFVQRSKQLLTICALFLVLTFTAACANSAAQAPSARSLPPASQVGQPRYDQLSKGDSPNAAAFGDWVVQKSQGLVKDAYVRDGDKLGVVLSPQVRPNEVRNLASSLVQGFRRNFPGRDLKVLVYAPDKQLVLTADYDDSTNRVEYK